MGGAQATMKLLVMKTESTVIIKPSTMQPYRADYEQKFSVHATFGAEEGNADVVNRYSLAFAR